MLALVSAGLVDGGTVIATGISPSLLNPALLHRSGFVVVQGSQPKALTKCDATPGGLEHAWGRFQFLVLRKVGRKQQAQITAGEGGVLFRALAGVSSLAKGQFK